MGNFGLQYLSSKYIFFKRVTLSKHLVASLVALKLTASSALAKIYCQKM